VSFRFDQHARHRAGLAAVIGVVLVVILGPLLAVPAVALVALVYYGHQVVAVLAGDEQVPYPALALVIVLNAIVVLLVQVTVLVSGFRPRG
jgi:hypothetical protein